MDISDSSNYSENTGYSNQRKTSRRSDLSLILNDNSLIQIASSANNNVLNLGGMNLGSLIQKAPLSKEAQQIAQFLQVPLQAQDTTNMATAVKSVVNAFKGRGDTAATQPTVAPATPITPVTDNGSPSSPSVPPFTPLVSPTNQQVAQPQQPVFNGPLPGVPIAPNTGTDTPQIEPSSQQNPPAPSPQA